MCPLIENYETEMWMFIREPTKTEISLKFKFYMDGWTSADMFLRHKSNNNFVFNKGAMATKCKIKQNILTLWPIAFLPNFARDERKISWGVGVVPFGVRKKRKVFSQDNSGYSKT